jgi:acetamidase/formamidase
MPRNANWILCDSKRLWNNSIELYRSEDNFDPVDVISSGDYISIKIKDENRFYAVSQSNEPGVDLHKIHQYRS